MPSAPLETKVKGERRIEAREDGRSPEEEGKRKTKRQQYMVSKATTPLLPHSTVISELNEASRELLTSGLSPRPSASGLCSPKPREVNLCRHCDIVLMFLTLRDSALSKAKYTIY